VVATPGQQTNQAKERNVIPVAYIYRSNPPAEPHFKITFMKNIPMTLFDCLKALGERDAKFISERDAHYKSSWKARGGIGAFFTIVRPWDRLCAIAERGTAGISPKEQPPAKPLDLFHILQEEIAAGLTEENDGTLQACIRDLAAYMQLLRCEVMQHRMAGSYQARPQPPDLDNMGVQKVSAGCEPVVSATHDAPKPPTAEACSRMLSGLIMYYGPESHAVATARQLINCVFHVK